MKKFLAFLDKLDRRIIFLVLLLAVILPFIFPLKLKLFISEPTRNAYDYIEKKLAPGSLTVLAFDYYATTIVECDPMALAVARHLFARGMKIITYSLIPDSANISMRIMNQAAKEMGKKYGEDYVILGFKSGSMAAIKSFCQDIPGTFPQDVYGKSISSYPLTRNLKNYRDIAFLFGVADNASLNFHIIMEASQYKIPVAGGCTAVSVPDLYVYLNSGQLIGLLGGLKGAAEYENLIHHPGTATVGMQAQSIAHFAIAFFIILANLVYFGRKKFLK